jgi:hypothetical protein
VAAAPRRSRARPSRCRACSACAWPNAARRPA